MQYTGMVLLLFAAAQCQIAQVAPSTNRLDAEFAARALAAAKLDPGAFNAIVMDSTFEITNGKSAGTGFVVDYPLDPKHPNKMHHVLCTADHVLTHCMKESKTVNILFRHMNGPNPLRWSLEARSVRIAEEGGRPLWVKHPTADIAVLPIDIPDGAIRTTLPMGILANAETLKEFYLGREVFILGFPFGSQGLAGFPILRPAKVATRAIDYHSSFALTFPIFPGDSGSPVYWIEWNEKGVRVVILGLVTSAMAVMTIKTASPQANGPALETQSIVGVGYAVPATEIVETLMLLSKKHVKAAPWFVLF
jgi:hypothetical protein